MLLCTLYHNEKISLSDNYRLWQLTVSVDCLSYKLRFSWFLGTKWFSIETWDIFGLVMRPVISSKPCFTRPPLTLPWKGKGGGTLLLPAGGQKSRSPHLASINAWRGEGFIISGPGWEFWFFTWPMKKLHLLEGAELVVTVPRLASVDILGWRRFGLSLTGKWWKPCLSTRPPLPPDKLEKGEVSLPPGWGQVQAPTQSPPTTMEEQFLFNKSFVLLPVFLALWLDRGFFWAFLLCTHWHFHIAIFSSTRSQIYEAKQTNKQKTTQVSHCHGIPQVLTSLASRPSPNLPCLFYKHWFLAVLRGKNRKKHFSRTAVVSRIAFWELSICRKTVTAVFSKTFFFLLSRNREF